MGLTLGFFHTYLITVPGLIRCGIVFLGVLCFIYESVGYDNDFFTYREAKYNHTSKGYGLGYRQEIMNEFFMIALLICWFFSLLILIALMVVKQAAESKNLNRFLHLGLGIFLMSAWICGLSGIFTFRSNCCHVNHDMVYNKSPLEGYTLRCRCFLTIKWKLKYRRWDDPEIFVYQTETWDERVLFGAVKILNAYPHDFEAHCLAHGSVFVMAFMYFLSFALV